MTQHLQRVHRVDRVTTIDIASAETIAGVTGIVAIAIRLCAIWECRTIVAGVTNEVRVAVRGGRACLYGSHVTSHSEVAVTIRSAVQFALVFYRARRAATAGRRRVSSVYHRTAGERRVGLGGPTVGPQGAELRVCVH